MATIPLNRVRFKKRSLKAIVHQLDGPEKPYPVYRFGGYHNKFERPEVPGQPYRWL